MSRAADSLAMRRGRGQQQLEPAVNSDSTLKQTDFEPKSVCNDATETGKLRRKVLNQVIK
jgi:hypothetical protein